MLSISFQTFKKCQKVEASRVCLPLGDVICQFPSFINTKKKLQLEKKFEIELQFNHFCDNSYYVSNHGI